MRIELDDEIEKKLDEIKSKNWYIRGKGHSETVRYLINHYEENLSAMEILRQIQSDIPGEISKGFLVALRNAFNNLLRNPDE